MRRLLPLLGLVVACQTPPPAAPVTDGAVHDAHGGADRPPGHDAGPGTDARASDAGGRDAGSPDGGGPDGPRDAGFNLLGPPLVFAPTASSFGLNAVVRDGDPATLQLQVRREADGGWSVEDPPSLPAPDVAQWRVSGLPRATRVPYRLVRADDADPLYIGTAPTTPPPGTPFTFAMITDTHLNPRDPLLEGTTVGIDFYGEMEQTMLDVMSQVSAIGADFVINLGDLLDYHALGQFNGPAPDVHWARLAYLNYRRLLGDTTANAAHFEVIGNWEGESGCDPPDAIARSTTQRLIYSPGPSPTTYAEGGSGNQDYYAFTWGDALFVVLNVMTYTPTCHLLDYDPGLPDDWTLGADQLAWLQRTLAGATSKWRFLFIHHTVGGAAGDPADTAYGRGGGQAAHVGEQAQIHAMMLQYGVQVFFYAHDHVFTDMVVDGIHYALPGSAGAPWKFDDSQTGYTQSWPDSGYARARVTPEKVQVDFVSITGQTLYGFALP
ncbi:MAG TPA: metallophosphoesterase [Polyangia bacterium]|nr:metallophosphoesterase [Polyangia bacterium]